MTSQKGMLRNIPSNENQRPATKATLHSKALNQIEGQIKSFPDKRSLKEYTSTKPALQEMLKGLLYEKKKSERERNTGTKKEQ